MNVPMKNVLWRIRVTLFTLSSELATTATRPPDSGIDTTR